LTRRRVKGCNSALFSSRATHYEADLSAFENAPQAHARFSCAQPDPRRAGSAARSPGQGAVAIERLSSGSATLPRRARLLRREHYVEALAAGRTRTQRYFTLYVRPNGESLARIGIITSKRVAPRAVDRNRMKRLVREAFRSMRQQLQGVDIVVQLRRCPPRSATATARAEVARLLEQCAAPTGGDGTSR